MNSQWECGIGNDRRVRYGPAMLPPPLLRTTQPQGWLLRAFGPGPLGHCFYLRSKGLTNVAKTSVGAPADYCVKVPFSVRL